MRPSAKDALVTGAVELVREAGYEALTFEALTARTGLSRSGIVYHFAQRELLVEAVCARLAADWEQEIAGHLKVSAEEATALERARAFLAAAIDPVDPARLLLRAAPTVRALAHNPWDAVVARWAPLPTEEEDPAVAAELVELRALAEGCAVRHALEQTPFDERALAHLRARARGDAGS